MGALYNTDLTTDLQHSSGPESGRYTEVREVDMSLTRGMNRGKVNKFIMDKENMLVMLGQDRGTL